MWHESPAAQELSLAYIPNQYVPVCLCTHI